MTLFLKGVVGKAGQPEATQARETGKQAAQAQRHCAPRRIFCTLLLCLRSHSHSHSHARTDTMNPRDEYIHLDRVREDTSQSTPLLSSGNTLNGGSASPNTNTNIDCGFVKGKRPAYLADITSANDEAIGKGTASNYSSPTLGAFASVNGPAAYEQRRTSGIYEDQHYLEDDRGRLNASTSTLPAGLDSQEPSPRRQHFPHRLEGLGPGRGLGLYGASRGPSSPRVQGHFPANITLNSPGKRSPPPEFTDASRPHSPALGATIGSSHKSVQSQAWWSPSSSRRIHPLALGPALVLGMFLAWSGLLGGSGTSIASGTQWRLPFTSDTASYHLDPRPPYVSHESGHIFMEQARASLGVIEHPIHALVRNATSQWDALLAKQSKSLAQAVGEYKRRYGRNPPKGFDDWYRFATERKVVLIDEYDQINRDIVPFLALSKDLLAERIRKEENDVFTLTLVIKNGALEIAGAKKDLARGKDQADLIRPFLKFLPDVNITMSAHDGPSVLLDRKLRDKHESYGSQGKTLTTEEANEVDDDLAVWGWSLACPSDSRIRRSYDGLEYGALPDGPSFVQDHIRTMDMCANPEWQYMHGFTSWQGPRPTPIRPLFSFSKTSMHMDLLCVPLEQFVNTPSSDPEWDDKKHAKIIWRGSMTGVWYEGPSWWRTSQRSRLHFLSQATSGKRWVRFTGKDPKTGQEYIREEEVDLPHLNEKYLDAGYVGDLHQCTQDEGGCEAIPKHIQTVKGMDWESQNDYKYIVDMDGNAWSGRFHRLMASNSLVLKSTIFPEWYSDRIMPWVHYVPLKVDYTDLYDLMAFFAGDLNGRGGHDDLAKQIALNGKDWTEKHWRWEDMQAYAFRLYLEWARVTAPDQTHVDFEG